MKQSMKFSALLAGVLVASCLMFTSCEDTTTTDCTALDCGPGALECDEGTCICKTGWFYGDDNKCTECDPTIDGADCTGVSNPCGENDCGANGTCNETTNECDCNAGWTGPNCDQELPSCVGVECGENQICNEATGECECDAVHTGDDCSQIDITEFLGQFSQEDTNCEDASGNAEFVGFSTVESIGEGQLRLVNFGGFGLDPVATFDGLNFSIPEQTLENETAQVTFKSVTLGTFNYLPGSGSFTMSIRYEFTSANTNTCDAILTKVQ